MWVPIAFISRKLSITGQNYSAFDRKLFANYTAIRNFRYYVEGKPFTTHTHHKLLNFVFSSQVDYSPQQSQHLSFTDKFAADIRHIHKKYGIVDTLCKIETEDLRHTHFQQLAKDQAAYIETLAYQTAVTD